jgi:hypothetical protein
MKARRLLPLRGLTSVALCTIVFATSASVTGLLVAGTLSTVNAAAGVQPGVYAIFPSGSRLPTTGSVSTSILENLTSAHGVKVASPEVVVPASVGAGYLTVRGVNLTAFLELDPASFGGSPFDVAPSPGAGTGYDASSAVDVGSVLAARLSLGVGDSIVMASLDGNVSVSAAVAGVFHTGLSFDDEVLAPLPLARELSGQPSDYVSVVRLALSNQSAFLSTVVIPEGGAPGPSNSSGAGTLSRLPALIQLGSASLATEVSGPAISVLQRNFDITQEALESIALVIALAGSLCIYFGVAWAYQEYSETLLTLRMLGSGSRRAASLLLPTLSLVAAACALAGYAIAYLGLVAADSLGGIQVLFHDVAITPDPVTALLVVSSMVGINFASAVYILRARGREPLAARR